MNVDLGGRGTMSRQIQELAQSVEKLEGEHKITLSELFEPGFMSRHTDFESFDEMVARSDWEIHSQEDLKTIPEYELDIFIRKHSVFMSYEEMEKLAGKEWVAAQLDA